MKNERKPTLMEFNLTVQLNVRVSVLSRALMNNKRLAKTQTHTRTEPNVHFNVYQFSMFCIKFTCLQNCGYINRPDALARSHNSTN